MMWCLFVPFKVIRISHRGVPGTCQHPHFESSNDRPGFGREIRNGGFRGHGHAVYEVRLTAKATPSGRHIIPL